MLLDRDCVEYVLYYAHITRFGLLSNIFLIQLGYIYSEYQKSCIIICQLLKNQVLCLIHLMLFKDQQFKNYMVKFSREKVNKEMNKLISSSWP